MFPEYSLQSLIHPSEWWIKNANNKLCRGALVFSFVPHVDKFPTCLSQWDELKPQNTIQQWFVFHH